MEKQYYIVVNGAQAGPFTKQALALQPITPSTLVWTAGLPEWVKISTLPELADLLAPAPQAAPAPQPYQQPAPQQPAPQQPYQQPAPQQPYQNPYQQQPGYPGGAIRQNWMPWAVTATVLGFLFSCVGLIFGIIAINNASKANKFYQIGDDFNGDAANKSAKSNTIIALVIAGVGLIINIIYFIALFS